ncbi:thioredoxin family protein [Pseudomonadota bacterium AL_CKDN230030165-1A_HGKHYDSX7]
MFNTVTRRFHHVGRFLAAAALAFGALQSIPLAQAASAPASAPEFTGIEKWLNSEPLTLQSLRGKVVLVDFWTYTCINCIRTLPYVTDWYRKYKDQGLVVVGVHTPEFPFERLTANVEKAIGRFGITYPVAQDNQYATWDAYRNSYWPAVYLIDKQGNVVYKHFGEGKYKETEAEIVRLLGQ